MIKGIIFDMDGVLVVNDHAHSEAFVIWSQRHNITLPEGFLSSYYGKGNDEIFRGIVGPEVSDEDISKFGAEKEEIYREVYSKSIAPTPGLIETLTELKRRGIKMAVGSSAIIENVDFVLDSLGIREYFSAISHSGLVERAKPAPDIFLLAAKLMELEPSECFVFEDAFAGVRAARSAGMKVGVLATSFSREQHNHYDIIADDFTGISIDEILK